MATRQTEHDHEDSRETRPAGKLSKKKLRRQRKRDKRQRELTESAARMGFLDDLDQIQAVREDADRAINNNGGIDEHEFAKALENDPELAEELRAVEKELAEAYPDKGPKEEAKEETVDKDEALDDGER